MLNVSWPLCGHDARLGAKPTIAAQRPSATTIGPSSPEAASRAGARQTLRAPIPESEVALLCNMSPSRFCREFKAAFAVTFVEYLATYRVSQAKRLLANPAMPVADVAVAVGFNDPSISRACSASRSARLPIPRRGDVRRNGAAKAGTT
jgi:AraC-like DNA-binding protein